VLKRERAQDDGVDDREYRVPIAVARQAMARRTAAVCGPG
jgi:hypothetical protein